MLKDKNIDPVKIRIETYLRMNSINQILLYKNIDPVKIRIETFLLKLIQF